MRVNGATVPCCACQLQVLRENILYIYIINIILYITRMLQEHLTRPLLPVVQRVV